MLVRLVQGNSRNFRGFCCNGLLFKKNHFVKVGQQSTLHGNPPPKAKKKQVPSPLQWKGSMILRAI